jgi:hypothetical protein
MEREEYLMALQIKKAQKFKQYARVCLWGTPKAGKSHTALALATTFAGEDGMIGVISSEYGSTKLLAHKFPHEIIDLSEAEENGGAPVRNAFSPQRYEEALRLFVEAGYKVIIIDSLSHSWAGEGGTLEAVSKAGKNSFTDGWGENTPVYNHLVNSILAARCHIIVTLRAKDAYIQEEYTKRDGRVGTMPKNIGQAPVMRKGFGFEMQLTVRMDSLTGYVEASAVEDYIHKGEEIEKPGEELAHRLLDALDGIPLPEPTTQQIEMKRLLEEFYSLSPSTYARITNWEQLALRKAFNIPTGALPDPEVYTDEHVGLMTDYLTAKKQEKQSKTA